MLLHSVSGMNPVIWFARRLDNLAWASAAFSTQTSTAAGLARLFIVFATAHFFLNAATLHKLTKAADGFLNRFFFSHVQLNHNDSVARKGCMMNFGWGTAQYSVFASVLSTAFLEKTTLTLEILGT
jgi:hypothetical protein